MASPMELFCLRMSEDTHDGTPCESYRALGTNGASGMLVTLIVRSGDTQPRRCRKLSGPELMMRE
jgi:hypothetical protein